jgi:hypothetical protein
LGRTAADFRPRPELGCARRRWSPGGVCGTPPHGHPLLGRTLRRAPATSRRDRSWGPSRTRATCCAARCSFPSARTRHRCTGGSRRRTGSRCRYRASARQSDRGRTREAARRTARRSGSASRQRVRRHGVVTGALAVARALTPALVPRQQPRLRAPGGRRCPCPAPRRHTLLTRSSDIITSASANAYSLHGRALMRSTFYLSAPLSER